MRTAFSALPLFSGDTRFSRYTARKMPPTPLRMWEGSEHGCSACWGTGPHRIRPSACPLLTTRGRKPGSAWPTRCGRARRSSSSPRCSGPAGRARPSSRSDSRTRCGRRGRLTCWPGSRRETGARSSPATRRRRRTWPAGATRSRHGRQRRPALPRLAAHDRAPLGGGTRRRGLPRRRRRAVAARPGGAGRRDQPAAGVRARLVRRRRDRARRRRVQQAGGARLPQRAAHRLPRPADRGA